MGWDKDGTSWGSQKKKENLEKKYIYIFQNYKFEYILLHEKTVIKTMVWFILMQTTLQYDK